MATALPPLPLISSATLRALSRMMSATATDAPRWASSFAKPMPMPLPPPVTTAALPAMSVIDFLQFPLRLQPYGRQHLAREQAAAPAPRLGMISRTDDHEALDAEQGEFK